MTAKRASETHPFRRGSGAGLLAFLLCACRVGPDYQRPELPMPDRWHQEAVEGLAEGEATLERWWERFGDETWAYLMERVAHQNLDLRGAMTRVAQARAQRGIATGERFPDLDGQARIERNRVSGGTAPVIFGRDRIDDVASVGVGAAWEIDVWGRITRSIEASQGFLEASVEDYRDVLVVIYAELGLQYVELRALQARIAFAEENIAIQRDTLELTRNRFDAQIAPELDVRQAELNLANTEASLPALRQALMRSMYRIEVLLGEPPGRLFDLLSGEGPVPTAPQDVAIGIPADTLRQRPDVRGAERRLAAQTARVGLATAELYPRFSLSGSFGLEAFDDLFDAGNRTWALGLPVQWNLFDGGRVRNAIALEEARTEEALVAYEQTVLFALEEVENALVATVQERLRRERLAASVEAAERSVELVKTLYGTGLTDFQNVLDAERFLTSQQDALAQSEGLAVQNLILLYRALGGGWQPDPEALEAELEDQEGGEPRF